MGQGKAGCGGVGHGGAGQGRAGQGRTGQGRTGQGSVSIKAGWIDTHKKMYLIDMYLANHRKASHKALDKVVIIEEILLNYFSMKTDSADTHWNIVSLAQF